MCSAMIHNVNTVVLNGERDKKTSDENGWNTISMKNDWKTIYGENVKKTK